jgi:hypothetical protein
MYFGTSFPTSQRDRLSPSSGLKSMLCREERSQIWGEDRREHKAGAPHLIVIYAKVKGLHCASHSKPVTCIHFGCRLNLLTLPCKSGPAIVFRGSCSLFPLPWLHWLSPPAVSEWVSEWVLAWMCLFLRFAVPKAEGTVRNKWQARCAVIEMLSSLNYEIPNVVVSVVVFSVLCTRICPPTLQRESADWSILRKTVIILHLVLYVWATCFVALREKYILWTWRLLSAGIWHRVVW